MWNVIFYNDDYTSIDFVVYVLTRVFHRSAEDALDLTFAVHTQGKAIAGTYTFEVATKAIRGFVDGQDRGASATG
jgi:ATP-dependent Clp protease adaptor protein ClpS